MNMLQSTHTSLQKNAGKPSSAAAIQAADKMKIYIGNFT